MSQPKPNQSSSSSRLKSRITLKNLKTSGSATATRTTDNNLFTNAESTMATLEGAAREIHYMSPIYFINQEDATLHESSEESQKSYRNMFVDPQSSPHAVYRSTLANLSDGLATLNEGDYIRWENDKDQKNGNISLMPPKYGGGLVKRQRPLSMHIFAQAESSNNSRTGTPNSRDMGPQKGKRNHVRAVRNRGIGEIDPKTYKRNYDSVIEYPHKQGSTSNNDSRWKGCGSMNEALEILKTEESIEALKKIHREEGESSECVPLVVLKEKYQRSTSVKNRRPLTQEFEEWKTTLMGRKEALLERREIKKKEKCAQEAKKEDMVLPKLNIGGDGLIVMPEKRDKERETVKHNSNFGEMRKTKLKWGISRPHSSKKKVLSIQSKENREIVKNKSQGPQEMQQVDQHEEVKPGRETTPIRNIRRLKCQGSASMVVWDEESLLQNMEPRYTEDRRWQTEEKGHSDQPKLKGLVPKLKIKQDFIMKQQLILVRSRAESRERSREKSKDYKYDVEKIIKGHKEGLNRLLPNGMPEYYNVGHENSVEVCTAQTILDQRMRALEDKYVRKDEGSPERDHVRTSPEPKKILKAGSLDVEGSHRREGSGRTQRVSFVLSTKKIGNAKSML